MECQDCKYAFKLPKSTKKHASHYKRIDLFCPKCGSGNISW